MGEEAQVCHTPTPSDNSNNQSETSTVRSVGGVSHINATRKKLRQVSQTPPREACQKLA